ncbi:MAG: methionine aminotransferase [Chloroflexota bacterium]
MTRMAQRVAEFGTTIFAEMTALAEAHEAVNLGQGFPDFAAPHFLKEAAKAAIDADLNQYAPSIGRARLRQAIAQKMANQYSYAVDPDKEVLITHGATEALFATILGLVNPGDEVIIFEPFYDAYVPAVRLAGGVPRFYTLRPPDWGIDPDQLAALFNDRTRLIIVNTPHNPVGKVYTQAELAQIATLCQQYDVVAMTDEVYEHIIFDGRSHHLLATLPGMAERTVTISSLGKSFSVTGWKVGWLVGPAELVQAAYRMHQYMTFAIVNPMQEAAAVALETAATNSYYADLAGSFQKRRDMLLHILQNAGLKPILPQGGYFIMVDISELGFADDVDFCHTLTKEAGVAAIPPSAFYHNPADGAGLARFAFCKSEALLQKASARLSDSQLLRRMSKISGSMESSR